MRMVIIRKRKRFQVSAKGIKGREKPSPRFRLAHSDCCQASVVLRTKCIENNHLLGLGVLMRSYLYKRSRPSVAANFVL